MKPSTRYSLILFGSLFFLIAAPILVLYISGTRFNFIARDTTSTGILDVKSNPSGIVVNIDGKDNNSTPAIIRFLNQGEYVIKLSKEGYFDWKKRLPIESGKVTYGQEGVDQIELLKKPNPVVIAGDTISDFVLVDDTAWMVKGNQIIIAPLSDPANQRTIDLPAKPKSLTLLRDKVHILAEDIGIINTNDRSLIPLPDLSSGTVEVLNDGTILSLKDQTLIAIDTKKTRTNILNNIDGFTILGNVIYFAQDSKGGGTISTGIWNGSQINDVQVLITDPSITKQPVKLLITDRKELFCQCGNRFARIGQKLEVVGNGILRTTFDLNTNEITMESASELWFYNFIASAPQLLTRSTTLAHSFLLRSDVGYGFIGTDRGLEAVEIDNRDSQNRYTLIPMGDPVANPVWQLDMSSDQKTIVALEGGTVVAIDIRN